MFVKLCGAFQVWNQMIGIQNRLLELISVLVFRYAWSVIIGFTLLGVAAFFYTAGNLGVNSNTAEMFDENLPFRQVRDQYNEAFPETEDNFVVVVSGPVPELVASVADTVASRFRDRTDLFESVFQPTGEPFFKNNQLLYLDTADLKQLSGQLVKAKSMMSFLSENYSLKGLFSFLGLMIRYSSAQPLEGISPMFHRMDSVLVAISEGSHARISWQNLMGNQSDLYRAGYSFIQVRPVLDYTKLRPAKTSIEGARNIIAGFNSEDVRVRITGKNAMTYEEMGSVMDGAIQASLLALVMVSLVLWIGLRSFRLIAATLYTLIVGLLLTAAFSAWAVGQLNMISIAFAVLYIGLGVDYAIHICLRYRELGREGFPDKESLSTSIYHITPALILSTLSTSIGFYAFVPTAFTGVSELGIIAGTGMFISLLVTLTLLPSLIWKLSGLRAAKSSGVRGFSGPLIEKYHRPIRMVTALLTIIGLVLLPGIKFDYDPINLRDPHSESVATVRELMADQSFTPWNLNVISDDSTELKAVVNRLRELPEAERVISIYSFIPNQQLEKLEIIKQLEQDLGGIDSPPFIFDTLGSEEQLKAIQEFANLLVHPAYAQITGAGLFGQHLKEFADSLEQLDETGRLAGIQHLQGGLLQSFPYTVAGLMNSLHPHEVSMGELPENLKQLWISQAGYRVQVMPAGEIETNQEMRAFANAVQKMAPEATGDLMVTIASGDTVVKAFKQAVIYALVAITVLLLVYLRSPRETLYIMLPLVLAGVLTGAVTVILGIQFNFANIIAVPLLLGLGVDNGVHIVHRAKTKIQNKGLLQTSTARAILFSSLTTLLSFGNLAFSPHRGTASMGWLLTIGVILVVMTTLIMLPAFMPGQKSPVRD